MKTLVEIFNMGEAFFGFLTMGSKHKRPFLISPQSLFQSEYKNEVFVRVVSCSFSDMNEN